MKLINRGGGDGAALVTWWSPPLSSDSLSEVCGKQSEGHLGGEFVLTGTLE